MSFSNSLSNAMSGLSAAARMANLVSSNVANSMTEGYGRRELELTSQTGGSGGGVRIASQIRVVDLGLLNDRRVADSAFSFSSRTASFANSMEAVLGLPTESGSLTDTITQFENRLIEAASDPSSYQRLSSAITSAQTVLEKLDSSSRDIQKMRVEADAAIEADVNLLNSSLEQIADLNFQIQRNGRTQQPVSALEDHRQRLIDQVAEIVPLKETQRQDGAVALMTIGGVQLLDGTIAKLEFSPTPTITPHMTLDSGTLGSILINGNPVSTDSAKLAGGRLAANFDIRDKHSVDEQRRLDQLAFDLISRFEDSGVDLTTGPADPGLFTDDGNRSNIVDLNGLSQRISLNALVDPAKGGEVWRFRDGLSATGTGDVGDSSLISRYHEALTSSIAPSSSDMSGREQSFLAFSQEAISATSSFRFFAESESAYASSKREALVDLERQQGVDTDSEMQKLLLIEQAYSANARVIQTIDEMIDDLMSI